MPLGAVEHCKDLRYSRFIFALSSSGYDLQHFAKLLKNKGSSLLEHPESMCERCLQLYKNI
jgi:hypothetical protein